MIHEQQVFVVDDDPHVRDSIHLLLESTGLKVRSFDSAMKFLRDDVDKHGCLIADIRMPGMSGLDLQAKLNTDRITIPIIFITAHGDERLRMQALRCGAAEFLAKPFDNTALLENVRAAINR